MYPRPEATEHLERLHPTARLGWKGTSFALLELYPARAVDHLLYERWNDKGPVYGSPYDPLAQVPVWLADFDPEEVQSMDFLDKVKRWLTPIKKRVRDSALAKGRELESTMRDTAGEYGEKLYRDAQRSCESGVPTPKKFLTDEDKKVLSGDHGHSLEEVFLPKDRDGKALV